MRGESERVAEEWKMGRKDGEGGNCVKNLV